MNEREVAKERILALRKELEKHRILYHVHDTPEISDEAYDSLLQELFLLEKAWKEFDDPFSPTKRVGGETLPFFSKVTHEFRQWSFDNVFSLKELLGWEERNEKLLGKKGFSMGGGYIAELKIDGLKVVLTYENGKLVRAATRGDGHVGEDVTNNIVTSKSIPITLESPLTLTVIGEVWMKKKELAKINEERKILLLPLYANTRNLAAGTLRQLDSKIVAKRNIQVFAYDVEGYNSTKTQEEELALLEKLGFLVNQKRRYCKSLSVVQDFYNEWKEKKNEEEYGIDGLVVKVNNVHLWRKLGYTSKSPRGGIAYKFPAEEATATILGITYQVGRTGVITPVAELSPTFVAGSLVKRATLHNKDEMERLDISLGDTVGLRKAGDVIPEIFSVFLALRPKDAKPFHFPERCPECSFPLEQEKVGKDVSVGIYCTNPDCPAKHIENLIHFVSKKAMNIEGLGEKSIEFLHDEGIITDYASLFSLKKEDIENLEGFGTKSAENLLHELEKSKEVELYKVLFALGIRHVGEETAKEIAKGVRTMEDVFHLSHEEYLTIPSIGEKVALSLIEYRSNEILMNRLRKLLPYVHIKNTLYGHKKEGKFSGMVFVLTGTYEKMSREEAKKYIEDEGGKVVASVSKKIDYVIAGDKPGSKVGDAEKIGIPIVTEAILR